MARDLLQHLRRQFAYDEWANREVLGALRNSRAPAARGRQLLAHILSAELLWLERLQQQPQTQPVWPELNVEQCEEWNAKVAGLWRDYFATLEPDDLTRAVSYKNSKGEPWTSTVEDVATHVLMHSAYHRGQLASWMRANGDTPAYTDFIHAVRQGSIG
jgi:uncharacterized damage-inducible protein DinB